MPSTHSATLIIYSKVDTTDTADALVTNKKMKGSYNY